VTSVTVPEPEPAKIRDSVPCTICDEAVMENQFAFPVLKNTKVSSNSLHAMADVRL
jgi:formylmethanofuran dehydrogenase subunit E